MIITIFKQLDTDIKETTAVCKLYYGAIFLYFFQTLILKSNFERQYSSEYDLFEGVVQLIILIIIIIKMASQVWNKKAGIFCAALLMLGIISWRTSGEAWLLWTILFSVSAQDIRIRPVAFCALAATAAAVLFVGISASFGLIKTGEYIRETTGKARTALGFIHPNIFGFSIVKICISFSVIKFGRAPLLDAVVYLIAAVLVMFVADSRTSAIILVVSYLILMAVTYSNRIKPKFNQIIKMTLIAVPAIILIGSIYFMIFYNGYNPIHRFFDGLLSGRLSLSQIYFNQEHPSLFGNSYITADKFTVDNAYCHIILRFGLVVAALYFIIYMASLIICIKKENKYNVIFYGLTVCAIYAMSEQFGLSIEFNYFVAIIPSVLFPRWGSIRRFKAKHLKHDCLC